MMPVVRVACADLDRNGGGCNHFFAREKPADANALRVKAASLEAKPVIPEWPACAMSGIAKNVFDL